MTAQELRIGNFITYEGKVFEVLSVGLTQVGIRLSHGATLTGVKYEEIEPIVLTPELLDKAGINKGGVYFLNKEKDTTLEIGRDGERYWLCIEKDGYDTNTVFLPREISYLHELQNLYYSLTGEEQNIKL